MEYASYGRAESTKLWRFDQSSRSLYFILRNFRRTSLSKNVSVPLSSSPILAILLTSFTVNSGQIKGLDLLEEVLTLSLWEPLNLKNLDKDISYFVSRPSTIENLCLFAWRNVGVVMRPHKGVKVVKVEVESQSCCRNEWSRGVEKVRVSYSGECTLSFSNQSRITGELIGRSET